LQSVTIRNLPNTLLSRLSAIRWSL